MRLTDKKLTLMALDAAIQWETELRDGSCEDQAAECQKIIDGYRRVIGRLSGGKLTITEMANEKALAGTRSVSLDELREMADAKKIKLINWSLRHESRTRTHKP